MCYDCRNSGITDACPIENRRVLDVFLLPDTRDISSYSEQILDRNGQVLDLSTEGAAKRTG